MLSESCSFFLRILSDHLNKRPSVLSECDDLAALLPHFRDHKMEGILFYQLKNTLRQATADEATRSAVARSYIDNCSRYRKREEAINKIEAAFTKENIPFLIFKGIELAVLYPMPALRTMGDTDILVHKEDKERADKVLSSLGFAPQPIQNDNEWKYSGSGLDFELHHALLYRSSLGSDPETAFFSRAWDYAIGPDAGSTRYHLDPVFHMTYLLSHLRKHFVMGGVGFRLFTDLAVFADRTAMDKGRLISALKKTGLYDFASVCFAFCERWFGVPMPFAAPLDDAFYEEATKKILKNGVLGNADPDNRDNLLLFKMRKSGKNIFFSKIRSLFQLVFPPCRSLRNRKHYLFLRRAPFLLPLAWIIRPFVSLFSGDTKKVLSKAGNIASVTEEQKNKREDFLQKWKL